MIEWHTGLCSVTFRALTPAQVVNAAAGAGIGAIEWAGDVHVPPGDLAAAQLARELTEDVGLKVSSYGSYISPPDDGLDKFREALITATALGADHIRLWPGTRGRDSSDYTPSEVHAVAQTIAEMGRMAKVEGITLGLEYHPQSLTDQTLSARRLIDAMDNDNVYLYWQPRPGLDAEEALVEIEIVGDAICHLHVFAWDKDRARYPLEAQANAWRRYVSAVPEGRWSKPRYAMLEFVAGDSLEQLAADAETLRKILPA